jgi:2-iminobutanoate/2-iminopropanoate deaminase
VLDFPSLLLNRALRQKYPQLTLRNKRLFDKLLTDRSVHNNLIANRECEMSLRFQKLAAHAIFLLPAFCISANGAEVTHMNSGAVLPTNLPFSEMVLADDTLYLSGQIGNIPGTLELASGGVEAQARQVLSNIKASLEANGYTMKNIVKCTVMLDDISDWSKFNKVYVEFFDKDAYPARSAFGVDGLALGALVEVDCQGVR